MSASSLSCVCAQPCLFLLCVFTVFPLDALYTQAAPFGTPTSVVLNGDGTALIVFKQRSSVLDMLAKANNEGIFIDGQRIQVQDGSTYAPPESFASAATAGGGGFSSHQRASSPPRVRPRSRSPPSRAPHDADTPFKSKREHSRIAFAFLR